MNRNQSFMNHMVAIMAKMMTEEEIINKLEEAIQKYRAVSNVQNKSSISLYSVVLVTAKSLGDKTVVEAMQEVEEVEDALKMVQLHKQNKG